MFKILKGTHSAYFYPIRRSRVRLRRTAAFLAIALGAVVLVYLWGRFIPESAMTADFSRKNNAPSLAYPFGTDWLGRNMLFRSVKGLSVSLTLGTIVVSVTSIIGSLIGMAAVVRSSAVDRAVLWVIDIMTSLPHMVFLVLISYAAGGGFHGIALGLIATHWTGLARIIRAEVLRLRREPFVLFSRKAGHGWWWILQRHIVPEIIPLFLVGAVLLFPDVIIHEAALSFLGFGLPPEEPAIGIVLAESVTHLHSGSWWLIIFPGLLLFGVVFCLDSAAEQAKKLCAPGKQPTKGQGQ